MAEQSIARLLAQGHHFLSGSGALDSRIDSEYLMAHLLRVPRLEMLLRGGETLGEEMAEAYRSLCERRANGIPLQYITGEQGFMGFTFHVDGRVLIPRPETELLCEAGIAFIKGLEGSGSKEKNAPMVLDLCTGSGALGISVALLCKGAKVHASDISETALTVAMENARGLGAVVTFQQGDFLEAVSGLRFHLILCNPPYIPTGELPMLQREVKSEPSLALDGGEDGLRFYRSLAVQGRGHLYPGGAIFCEVGYDQGERVSRLFEEQGYKPVSLKNDLANIPRLMLA